MNESVEPAASSQIQRAFVTLAIFVIALIGFIGNLAVFMYATNLKILQNSFGRLSASQSFAEAILCAVFLCFYCPMVLLVRNTRILIGLAYAIPCFTSIYMHLAHNCLLPYVDFGWYFGVNTSVDCDVIRFYVDFCKDFSVVAAIAVIDIVTIIMIKVTAVETGAVFAAELVLFFIVSSKQTHPVLIFLCTTVAWSMVHTIDPLVLILLNREFRNMLMKNPMRWSRNNSNNRVAASG
ncbi:hypothetical protein GCK72_019185 [Caenorhabditis remanei]|uniref:7TM GPCR serpentine receptor class x (Srx) domain-containing protein n=1 Tax=Caenorhabditis remanei TaxID=31234 RepID=A0A6A5GC07_CAERE|nr:hypothetical protein GCK72_019185 [Caenorhabditis remanei]KAF1752630.1 hypothetical protein GCK72_019185 [Caenorhabditis remanei]